MAIPTRPVANPPRPAPFLAGITRHINKRSGYGFKKLYPLRVLGGYGFYEHPPRTHIVIYLDKYNYDIIYSKLKYLISIN